MYRTFFLSNSSEAIPLNIRCANVVLFIYVPHKIVFKRIVKDNVTNKQNLNLSIIVRVCNGVIVFPRYYILTRDLSIILITFALQFIKFEIMLSTYE